MPKNYPGKGKYTQYAPPSSDKNTLLNKLFKSNDANLRPITQDLVGQEEAAISAVIDIAIEKLQPAKQAGDMRMFPQGVDLNYSYASVDPAVTPNLEKVEWKNAGDPANSYVPDISSPGPGKTDGVDKSTNPEIKSVDIKPNYVPGAPGTGTKSPVATSAKIVAANLLGANIAKGDSGSNI